MGVGAPPRPLAPASMPCSDLDASFPVPAPSWPGPALRSEVQVWKVVWKAANVSDGPSTCWSPACWGCAFVTSGGPRHSPGRWVLLLSLFYREGSRGLEASEAPSVTWQVAVPSPDRLQRLGERAPSADCVSHPCSHRAQRQPGSWAEPGGLPSKRGDSYHDSPEWDLGWTSPCCSSTCPSVPAAPLGGTPASALLHGGPSA